MKIKVWGSRGTLPTPGSGTLKYGGNTTCIEIKNQHGFRTIVDAGSGIRLLGKEILSDKSCDEMCLVLTHSHWDHLMGFPFFVPAYFSKYKISVCGVASAKNYMKQSLARQLEAPYFPVDFEQLKAQFSFECSCPGNGFCKRIITETISLNHPNGGFGYKFTENNKVFVFLTDNELRGNHEGGKSFEEYVEFCKGADVLFHDAQYTDKDYEKTIGWGHSTFNQAVELALKAEVKELGFFHHDPDRTDEDLDSIIEKHRNSLSQKGSSLKLYGVFEGMEIDL